MMREPFGMSPTGLWARIHDAGKLATSRGRYRPPRHGRDGMGLQARVGRLERDARERAPDHRL